MKDHDSYDMNPEKKKSRNSWKDFLEYEQLRTAAFWRAVVAEVIGTLLLVYIVCTVCVDWSSENGNSAYLTRAGLAIGLTLMIIVEAMGHISGAHVNPAVTTGLLVACRIDLIKGLTYIVAQLIGAVLGAAIALGVTPENVGLLPVTVLNPNISQFRGMIIEVMITFTLVLTVLGATDLKWKQVIYMPSIPIGLALTIGVTSAGKYTGASINPARSFGPAIVLSWSSDATNSTQASALAIQAWEDQWVYWVGPLLGGVIAALVYQLVFGAFGRKKEVRNRLSEDEILTIGELLKERPYQPYWVGADDIMIAKITK